MAVTSAPSRSQYADCELAPRSASYQAGYLQGLLDARAFYDQSQSSAPDWARWFRIRDQAWEAVYRPSVSSDEQLGYADALYLVDQREGSGLHILL